MLSINEIQQRANANKGNTTYSAEMIACEHDSVFWAYFDSVAELEEFLEENDISANPSVLHTEDNVLHVKSMRELEMMVEILEHEDTDIDRLSIYLKLIDDGFAQLDTVMKYYEEHKVGEFKDDKQFGRMIADHREVITSDFIRKYFDYEQYGKDVKSEFVIIGGYAFEDY